MKPLISWAGSKTWLVELLGPYWDGERIVEPFCGSAAFTFSLEPKCALLADANASLASFFQWAQDGCTPFQAGMVGDEVDYYEIRRMFNLCRAQGDLTLAQAWRFFYLNRHGFNHLWRVNAKGDYNVPFRGGVSDTVPPFAVPRAWQFVAQDWQVTAQFFEERDFVFADPPYFGTFDKYTDHGWGMTEHVRLARTLQFHPGKVAICNACHPSISEMYRDFGYHVWQVEGRQMMHRSQGHTGRVNELVATNFCC